MILAMVGTHNQQFNRLLKELDSLVERGRIKEEVFAQTGCSDFEPKNYKTQKMLSLEEYKKLIKKASLVITHGGAGSIIDALNERKKLIIVPRLAKFGEHTNDHQLDLAEALQRQGKAITIKDIKKLESAIKEARKSKAGFEKNSRLEAELRKCLENHKTSGSAK